MQSQIQTDPFINRTLNKKLCHFLTSIHKQRLRQMTFSCASFCISASVCEMKQLLQAHQEHDSCCGSVNARTVNAFMALDHLSGGHFRFVSN